MQIPGAKDVGIEFHSLSKTYNMTGWRIGFAVGNNRVIAGLGKIKTNIDSGDFQAIQEAGIEALNTDDAALKKIRDMYQGRRDALCDGLKNSGFLLINQRPLFTCGSNVRRDTLQWISQSICSTMPVFSQHREMASAHRGEDI